jgi:hypothetical protein
LAELYKRHNLALSMEKKDSTKHKICIYKNNAIEFCDWVRDNTILDGCPKRLYRPTKERLTTEELYKIYCSNLEKIKKQENG